ncbi:hypothetical protein E6O75_ATG05886 [Venturia nashicola]|uniref:Zn(2)-C6 fungal-type domain-containing protein n=1 Tax=Venturia nashicola TaxID=86259 RepID=A0A4Z1P3K3_9PEZI|nr:hypothetical protein E6O75_ATG05886 [Venturia nashicola]
MAIRTNRQNRTACDQCYKLKERCSRVAASTTCGRCERLCLSCTTNRPVKPAGRRPRGQHQSTQSLSENTTSQIQSNESSVLKSREALLPDIAVLLEDAPDLDSGEKELLIELLGRADSFESFIVAPKYQGAEQRFLSAPLPAALPILKDAYLACAGALRLIRSGVATDEERNASTRRASAAMITLRSLSIANSQDAALLLTLGTALAWFVYSAIGIGLGDICHYCLSVTMPFIDNDFSDSDARTGQHYLVLLEIMECLTHRRKPTLRVKARTPETVDRHVGLCLPMIQHYHDLCVISHSMISDNNEVYQTYLERQLDDVQTAIETWQPPQSDRLIHDFNSTEVVNLLAQAKVYRLAGLLVGHRLRYKFGEEDSKADMLSKEIMIELELARRITKQPIRCVTIPFIAAAVEIRDPVARANAYHNVDKFVDHFTPVVQQAARKFLCQIWQERDSRGKFSWYDSIHKPCVVWHTVNLDCIT